MSRSPVRRPPTPRPRRRYPWEGPLPAKQRPVSRRHRDVWRQARRSHRQHVLWGTLGALAAALGVAVVIFALSRSTAPSRVAGPTGGLIGGASQGTDLQLSARGMPAHGQTVDGIDCYPQEGTAVHLHIVLDFYANGRQGLIPPGLGIVAPRGSGVEALGYAGDLRCIYPVHVHVADNLVHVESDFHVTYTLGQLFALWGQPLSRTQVAGYIADHTHPLSFAIMDAQRQLKAYSGDPSAIPLADGETIVILYSTSSFKLSS